MARRMKSIHHNLGDKNVVFHREHRSKKNRQPIPKFVRLRIKEFKHERESLEIKELDRTIKNLKNKYVE